MSSPPDHAEYPKGRLRVATYNIRLGLEQGLEAVADVLRRIDADIVALQEIGQNWTMGDPIDQVAWLADRLGMSCAHHCTTILTPMRDGAHRVEEGAHRYGHAVLSRLPLSDIREVALPREHDEPRCLFVARTELSGMPLSLVAAHLSHLDVERPAHIDAMLHEIAALGEGPLLVLGDMNEPQPEAFLDRLAEHGLQDLAENPAPTFPASAPTDRRDIIAVRGPFEVVEPATVVPTVASDHLAVAATLRVAER